MLWYEKPSHYKPALPPACQRMCNSYQFRRIRSYAKVWRVNNAPVKAPRKDSQAGLDVIERATAGISEPGSTHHRQIQSSAGHLELTFSMSISPRDIPTSESIAVVSKLEVRDEKGQAVTFGSLFEEQKTVIIFIRACFCCRRPSFAQCDSCRPFLLWCTYSHWLTTAVLSNICGY